MAARFISSALNFLPAAFRKAKKIRQRLQTCGKDQQNNRYRSLPDSRGHNSGHLPFAGWQPLPFVRTVTQSIPTHERHFLPMLRGMKQLKLLASRSQPRVRRRILIICSRFSAERYKSTGRHVGCFAGRVLQSHCEALTPVRDFLMSHHHFQK
jgi:hypothetical protein